MPQNCLWASNIEAIAKRLAYLLQRTRSHSRLSMKLKDFEDYYA